MTKKTSYALIRLQQENEKLKEDFAEKLKEKNAEIESLKASFADLDVLKHRVDELGSIHIDLIKERDDIIKELDEYYDALKKVQTENTRLQSEVRSNLTIEARMKCLEENYQHVISAGSLLQKQLEDRNGEIETLRAVITTCIRQGLISTKYLREAYKKDGVLAGLHLCKNFVDDIVAGKVV